MLNVLITGATGNVGIEVIKSLQKLSPSVNIVAGLRDTTADSFKLKEYHVNTVKFDITDPSIFATAFKHIDVIFLLRPPQILEVKKYFEPLINSAIEALIQHIVFLSVQGVEKSSFIPHYKIEKLIIGSKIPYTFLRPAYFMQNFTTTLRDNLVNNKLIYLPAGYAKFTLVDVKDIGNVAAMVLLNTGNHVSKVYELTCKKKFTFFEMAAKLSGGLGVKIKFISPDLLTFYLKKRNEKMPVMLILVMIMLHYFPRFQKDPSVTDCIKMITQKEPITFEQFIKDNKNLLVHSKV